MKSPGVSSTEMSVPGVFRAATLPTRGCCYCIVVRKDAWNDFYFFEFTKASFMAQDVIYPEDVSDPGIKPLSPALQKDSLPLSHLGMEKEMATHSSILAWRIPWTKELGGLQSTGRKELDTTERLHFTHFHLGNPPGRARSSFKASRKFALKKETWGGSQPLCTKPAFRESPLHSTPHTRPCGKMSPVWRAVGGVSLGEE